MRSYYIWLKMIFDFIKRLFGLVDETPRKRRAEDSEDDYATNYISPKKHCCGHDVTGRFNRDIYADENDGEEEIQFVGETNHYSPKRSKEHLNGTSCGKRKLSATRQRSNDNRNKSVTKMNGRDSKMSRFTARNINATSHTDCKQTTLTKANQLRDKHVYGQLLQNFLPSRVQIIRNKPQQQQQQQPDDDSKRRNSVTEIIDLDKFQTPSTSLVNRGSWNQKSTDVFFTPQASTPLKYYTPCETKPKAKNDSASLLSSRRILHAKNFKGDDTASRRTSIERSGAASRIIPIIKVCNVDDVSPIVSPTRPPVAKKIEQQPQQQASTSHNARTSKLEILSTNTLRDNLAAKAVMKQDYIHRIYGEYNERREQRMKEAEELKRMTCMMSKNNRLTREAALEVQLARSMRLCEAVLDDTEQLDEDALPTLTPPMLLEIKDALIPNPPNECLVESFGLRITRKDIHTLYGLNWLNDEVINFYMNLLISRGNGTNDKYPRVHAMNTFFYPKLLSGGHSSLKRWTRKIDVFAQDLLVVPIHLGIHWCMSIVDFREKSIRYYDSMGGSNPKCLNALRQYLEDESIDKKKRPFATNDWKLTSMKNIPQQMNGSDCGVFSCMFAEFITANRKITFTQQDMPYFREKMVYEILKAKLL